LRIREEDALLRAGVFDEALEAFFVSGPFARVDDLAEGFVGFFVAELFAVEAFAEDGFAFEADAFFVAVPLDCAELAGTPSPTALRSKVRAGSAGRSFRIIVVSRGFSSTPFIGCCPSTFTERCPPARHPAKRRSECGRCLVSGEP
jgi:hypothetical protein